MQGVFRVHYKAMKKIVLAGLCIFFLSFSALVVYVFLAGNFQGFTAFTLLLLLDILKYSSFLCTLAGAGYLACLLAGVFRKTMTVRRRDYALAGVSFAFGLFTLLVSQFIIVVTLPKL